MALQQLVHALVEAEEVENGDAQASAPPDHAPQTPSRLGDAQAFAVLRLDGQAEQSLAGRRPGIMQEERLEQEIQRQRKQRDQRPDRAGLHIEPDMTERQNGAGQRGIEQIVKHSGEKPPERAAHDRKAVLRRKGRRRGRRAALELLEIFWGVQLGKADMRGFDLPADSLGGRRLLLLAFELGKLRAERIGERLFAGLERADVVQTDVQAPQEPDAQQRLHVLLGIVTVAVWQTLRGQKPLALIKADVRAFHLAARFDLPDRHGRTSFARIHPKHTV